MGDSYAGIAVPEGDPGALDRVAGDFGSLAGATSGLSSRLGAAPAALGGWQGPASLAFAGVSMITAASAMAASQNFAVAASEARRYADVLREAREEARQAIEDARDAQRRIDRAEQEIEDARAKRSGAALRYVSAVGQLLLPDLTGASASSARNDLARAQEEMDAADAQERKARLELEDARDDLERARRRGERAERGAADAARAAADAFAAVGAGLPGTPVPGSPAYAAAPNGTAPALTPFARLATGGGFGDSRGAPGAPGAIPGPLAALLAGLSTAPSTDYRSWQDPERRQIEQEMLYDDADPATEEFDIEDLDGLDQGKLRVGLFIQAQEAGPFAIPLLVNPKLEGNSRGFNPQFSPNQTKGYIELDFERDKAYVQVNPTCDADGSDCEDAKDIAQDDIMNFGDYKNEVEPNDTDGDEVHLSWEMTQAKGTKYLPWEAAELVSGPSIDGDLHVRPGPDGKPIVELDGDDFPSREVYYDDGQGRTYEVIPPREEDGGWGPLGDGSYKLLPGIN